MWSPLPFATDPVTKLADERSHELPLTQDVIGDALGLSLAYVNRVLRRISSQARSKKIPARRSTRQQMSLQDAGGVR